MLLILEGLVMAFGLLLVCVVGIRNGAVGLVTFYEKDVQDRVVELGLTTRERIKKSSALSALAYSCHRSPSCPQSCGSTTA